MGATDEYYRRIGVDRSAGVAELESVKQDKDLIDWLMGAKQMKEDKDMDAVEKVVGKKQDGLQSEESLARETVLEEAARVTTQDRNEDYGNPEDNLSNTADLWSSYLDRKYGSHEHLDLGADDVCMMMILLKISRQAHSPKRDNLVDICGWARLVERMADEA